MQSITNQLSTLDWGIFFLILALTYFVVIWGHFRKRRESNSILDYMLMGRRLTLPLFVATLVATWYGGIFGVTQIAYEKGIYNFITQGVFWYISYVIFALFLVKKVHKYNAVTLPDLIGKMFGPKSAKLGAFFNFFNVVPIVYSISIGILIKSLFGTSLIVGMSLGVFIAISYSMIGGFRAVVFSDIIQFVVMILGVFLIAVFSVKTFGGLDFLQANLPATHFSPFGGEGILTTFVWGFIALSTLVDPNFYQRCFGAENPKIARNGILISTVIWIGFDICTTTGAMYAAAVLPNSTSNEIYLIYAMQILPHGLKGFVLAGILATILSTLDSYLFIASNTVTYDMLPERFRHKRVYHYMGMLLIGALAVCVGAFFDGNIRLVWKTLGSYSAACLLFPVLYGYIFPGKVSDKQFITACLSGVVATTYWRLASHSGFWANVDELYIGVLTTFATLIFYGSLRGLVKQSF